MQDITKAFNFGGHQVRVVVIASEPWFVLADLIRVLGMSSKPAQVSARLDADGVRQADPIPDSLGREQTPLIVNESNMWLVILRSDSPAAEPVRRWVTRDVLPAIRRTGTYGVTPALTGPALMAAALIEADATIKAQAAQIEADAPKVLFADAVATSHTDILVGDLAKILRGNGVEVGANRLFDWLRRDGFLIRRRGTDWNMPTQRAMELGLFRVKETSVIHSDGHTSISKTPKVTGKGQTYFIRRYLGGEDVAA